MKTTSAILSLLLAQNASAFTTAFTSSATSLSAATSTAETTSTFSEEEMYKYDTEVNTEKKFKVADNIDKSIYDPKKRVQT